MLLYNLFFQISKCSGSLDICIAFHLGARETPGLILCNQGFQIFVLLEGYLLLPMLRRPDCALALLRGLFGRIHSQKILIFSNGVRACYSLQTLYQICEIPGPAGTCVWSPLCTILSIRLFFLLLTVIAFENNCQ